MTEKHLTTSYTPEEKKAINKQKETKLFQIISFIFLPLFWIGYFYSLYKGNQNNIFSYSIAILTISLLHADVLMKGEKTQYKIFDIMARLESMLLVILGIITIVLVFL